MSSPLAIAAVTAILKDLLNDGLINNDLSPIGSFSVSAIPPDRVTTGPTEDNRLNLFLYQVTPNIGWRNASLPSHGPNGERLTNPPLALDLHYLLTAYGQADFNAEILLGYAMELFHNTGIIGRTAIRRSLSPANPITVNLIPNDPEGRAAIDLADQMEALKVSPHYLSADELSRMWTAMQARYRPSIAYQVSTVLIQSTRPTRATLPVLKRGSQDRGVTSQPNVGSPAPAWPMLATLAIRPPDKSTHASAELGDTLALGGGLLTGQTVTAVFNHPRLANPIRVGVDPASTDQLAIVKLPAVDTTQPPASWPSWPAGNYTVSLEITNVDPVKPNRTTNELPFALAPRLYARPHVGGVGAARQLTVEVFPQLWPGQRIDVYVAGEAFRVAALAAETSTATVAIGTVQASEVPVPVRVRVDGIDSLVVRDQSAQPPGFDAAQTVTV